MLQSRSYSKLFFLALALSPLLVTTNASAANSADADELSLVADGFRYTDWSSASVTDAGFNIGSVPYEKTTAGSGVNPAANGQSWSTAFEFRADVDSADHSGDRTNGWMCAVNESTSPHEVACIWTPATRDGRDNGHTKCPKNDDGKKCCHAKALEKKENDRCDDGPGNSAAQFRADCLSCSTSYIGVDTDAKLKSIQMCWSDKVSLDRAANPNKAMSCELPRSSGVSGDWMCGCDPTVTPMTCETSCVVARGGELLSKLDKLSTTK